MRKILSFAEFNGFDGFVMLNLYPQRTPKPYLLDHLLDINIHKINLSHIEDVMQGIGAGATILLAYGDNILIRDYLIVCLQNIVEITDRFHPKYVKIGELTKNKNPRHPLYCKVCKLTDYDIKPVVKIINPYVVVREEQYEKVTASDKSLTRKGYDSKGRLVMIEMTIESSDGIKSHCFESVGSNGYWSGGMGIEHPDGTYISGQTVRRKIDEEI